MTSEQAASEKHLQQLKHFIYDEDRIVTSIWICKMFKLDIKAAALLLNQFVQNETSANSGHISIGVNYILSGTIEQHGKLQARIQIARDSELDAKKKVFKELTSQGIYSVQKGKGLILNTVEFVDVFKWHGENRDLLGCYVSPNCTKRENLRTSRVLPSVERVASTDKSKGSHLFAKSNSNNSSETEKAVEKQEAAAAKTESNNEAKKQPEGKKLLKQSSNDKNKGMTIANLFANAPPPKKKQEGEKGNEEKTVEKKQTVEEDGKEAMASKMPKGKETELYDSGTDEEANKIEKELRKKRKNHVTVKSAKKRQRKDHSCDRPEKMRKRIVEFAESDDDMFGSEEDSIQVEILISDEEISVEQRVTVGHSMKRAAKRRKWVDRTYEDEEGYMVTNKELVVVDKPETDGEDNNKENPQNVKKETIGKQPSAKDCLAEKKGKKNQPTKPTNQSTLTNFFKRK